LTRLEKNRKKRIKKIKQVADPERRANLYVHSANDDDHVSVNAQVRRVYALLLDHFPATFDGFLARVHALERALAALPPVLRAGDSAALVPVLDRLIAELEAVPSGGGGGGGGDGPHGRGERDDRGKRPR
jgi:hypothetical protein